MSLALKMALIANAHLSRTIRVAEYKAFDNAQLLRIETRLSDAGVPRRNMSRILKRARGRKARVISLINASGVPNASGKGIHVPLKAPEPKWIADSVSIGVELHTERTVYLRRELRAAYLLTRSCSERTFQTWNRKAASRSRL